MNNSDFLVNKSDFKRALNTEFSRLFIENRITERSLIDYFEQDYFFVLEDLKVLKKLIELSEDKNMFSWFMSLINNDELNFFNRFFYENNIDIKKIEISKTTRKYIDYIESIIEKDDFILILSMLLAGEWIYLETFSGKNSKNIYIGEWEKLHSNDLKRFVDFMRNIIDNSVINDDVINVFGNTVNLEIEFFCQFL